MTPIINVEWEHHVITRNHVADLTRQVQELVGGVRVNQVAINEIKQQLADGVKATGGGGMGFPQFKNAQYFKFTLEPNKPAKVVESLPEPGLRQLIFKSTALTFLEYRGSGNILNSPLELHPAMVFTDDFDGGDEVWALSPNGATLYIQVRTAENTNDSTSTDVGDDFVIPLKTELILDSRVLDLVSFHPGQKYTFTIQPSEEFEDWLYVESDYQQNSRYKDKCIEVYAPNFYNTIPSALRDFVTSNSANFDSAIIGTLKHGGWVQSFGRTGGTFDFYPDFSHRHLLFFARYSDWATRSSGEQNLDPGSGYAESVQVSFDSVMNKITLIKK